MHGDDYAIQFRGTVPIAAGALRFDVAAGDEGLLDLAKQMLATLVLRSD